MLDIIPSSGSKNDTSMKPMNIQSRITMAGSITDMNRDSLASVSSSQDVHICCMTSVSYTHLTLPTTPYV